MKNELTEAQRAVLEQLQIGSYSRDARMLHADLNTCIELWHLGYLMPSSDPAKTVSPRTNVLWERIK